MNIRVVQTSRGFCLEVSGAWTAEPLEMRFPERIWEAFPAKEALMRELVYVLTLAPPVILDHPTVWYSTPPPRFFDLYNDSFEQAIPNFVEHVPEESSEKNLARFRAVARHFEGTAAPSRIPPMNNWIPRRAVVPFSYGKDSLLTVATLRALGVEVFPVLIDERVLPRGMALRRSLVSAFEQEHGLSCLFVENEIQLLSDWQVLGRPRSELNRVHVHFVYLLAMLPFCVYFRAPLVAFSNEHVYSLNTLHREGYLHPRGVMQSPPVMRRLTGMLKDLSGGQLHLINPICPLGNFAIHRLLHQEFADYGGYRVSCHLELTDHARWCHNCYRCAQAYLFSTALGMDPAAMGFEASMLEEDKARHFALFHRPIHPKDVCRRHTCAEEGLAFSMAARRKASDPLVKRFEAEVGTPSFRRVRRMSEKVFRIQTRPGPHRIEKEAGDFYRKRLKRPLPV
ncbi:MAG: hypothetical protein K9L59_07215 [Desulfobacterales bacterium]|nr:hypothetical protein [Desulfobacterales bacterium]